MLMDVKSISTTFICCLSVIGYSISSHLNASVLCFIIGYAVALVVVKKYW